MKKTSLLICFTIALTACVTLTGNYELKAVDSQGQTLNKRLAFTATGSGIYTARNALCEIFPKAKIIITDVQTKQELARESPYQCR